MWTLYYVGIVHILNYIFVLCFACCLSYIGQIVVCISDLFSCLSPTQFDFEQGGLQLFFPFVLGAVHIWNGKQASFSWSIIADTQDCMGKEIQLKNRRCKIKAGDLGCDFLWRSGFFWKYA